VIEVLELAGAAGTSVFHGDGTPAALDGLLAVSGPWEVEIGFGKGRFLLARAAAEPGSRFLGIEVAGEFFRLAARRLTRRRLDNVVLLRGDALAILAARLPRGFAARVHVYFPDPWPKKRHLKRRLFSAGAIDIVLGTLEPGGEMHFATDYLSYGDEVESLLAGLRGVEVKRLDRAWSEGARTNYEAKYVAEGRPIVRLVARVGASPALHPDALGSLAIGPARSAGTVGDARL